MFEVDYNQSMNQHHKFVVSYYNDTEAPATIFIGLQVSDPVYEGLGLGVRSRVSVLAVLESGLGFVGLGVIIISLPGLPYRHL